MSAAMEEIDELIASRELRAAVERCRAILRVRSDSPEVANRLIRCLILLDLVRTQRPFWTTSFGTS